MGATVTERPGASRRVRRFTLIASFALLAGCGIADFAYDLAPRLAVRYVDDYLQLSNRQEARALELFRARHAVHASDELPRYFRFLRETRAAFRDGLTRAEVDRIFTAVESLAELGIHRSIPAVAEILDDLDIDQVNALAERLQESAAEYCEKLDDDHAGRRRVETLEDIEEWIGPVDDAQRAMIIRELEAMNDTRPLWLKWRIRKNEELIALLRADASTAEIEAFLEDYWLRRDGLTPELVAGRDENRERYREMIVALDASLSVGQREKTMERINEYLETVTGMMPAEVRTALRNREPEAPVRK